MMVTLQENVKEEIVWDQKHHHKRLCLYNRIG